MYGTVEACAQLAINAPNFCKFLGRDYAFAAMDRTATIETLWSIVRSAESR